MRKSVGLSRARRTHGRRHTPELPNAVEWQIAEICRDLAVQAKRMRELQERADELCTVIRHWAGGLDANLPGGSPSRGGRR